MVNGALLATEPVALNAVSDTVTGVEPGFDTANLDCVVAPPAAACGTGASGSWSTRIRSGENPLDTAPPSGTATSKLERSTILAWAVTPCGEVTTTKPCLPDGDVDVSCSAQRTTSAVGAPALTDTGMSRVCST